MKSLFGNLFSRRRRRAVSNAAKSKLRLNKRPLRFENLEDRITPSNFLYASTNGLLSFLSPNSEFQNQDMTSDPSQAAIAPLWDDWYFNIPGSQMILGKIDTSNNTLIVEWNQVQHFPGTGSGETFEAILQLDTGATNGDIIFNYGNLASGDGNDNGASASVGVKDVGTQGPNRLLLEQDGSSTFFSGGTIPNNTSVLLHYDTSTNNYVPSFITAQFTELVGDPAAFTIDDGNDDNATLINTAGHALTFYNTTYGAPAPAGPHSASVDFNNGTLVVFDSTTYAIQGTVPIPFGGGSTLNVVISPDDTTAYVSDFFSSAVWVVDLNAMDLATGTNPIFLSGFGGGPEAMSITPDGNYLLATDGGGNTALAVVDLTTRTQIGTVTTTGAQGFDVGPDDSIVVVDSNSSLLLHRYTIDATGSVTDTGQTASTNGGMCVTIAPGGLTGVATGDDFSGNTLTSFRVSPLSIVSTVPLGSSFNTGPIGGVFSPAGDVFYVRQDGSGTGIGEVDAFSFDPTTGVLGSTPFFSFPVVGTPDYFGIRQIALSSDSSQILVPENGVINAYDATTGAFINTVVAGGSSFVGIAIGANPGQPADHFVITNITSPITAGTPDSFTITALDPSGNTVTNYFGTVHFTSTDTNAILPANYRFTASDNGVHTFTATFTTAGTQTLTVTDASTPTATGSTDVDVTPAAPDHIGFSVQPSDTVAGVAISPAIELKIFDLYGNLTSDSSDTVTISILTNPGGGTLSGTTTVTANNGIATFSDLSIDKAGAGYQLLATPSGGLGADVSFGFTIVPAAPTLAVYTVQPTDSLAGNAISPAVRLALYDPFGNLATNDDTDTVTIALGNNPTGATLSGTTTVTATAGLVTFPILSVDKVGVGYTLQMQAFGSVPAVDSNSFTVTAGAPGQLVILQQPGTTVAGAILSPPITVQIEDGFGNPLNNDNIDFVTLAIGANPGGGTLHGTTSVRAVNGVATFSNLWIDKSASGYTLVATSGALQGNSSNFFTITPAAADHLDFTTEPNGSLVAGVNLNAGGLHVVVEDRFQNVVTTDNTDQVSLALATNPGGGTLFGVLTQTVTNGVAILTPVAVDKVGVGYTLRATTPGLGSVLSTPFSITPAAADHLAYSVQPSNTVAGKFISPPVVVEVHDRFDNLVTFDNSDTVTLSLAGVSSGGTTLNGTLSKQVSGGVASFSDLSINRTGSGYNLVATAGTILAAASIDFTISPDKASQLAFGVQPSDTTAGIAIKPALTVQVLDQFGNLVDSDNTDRVNVRIGTNPAGGTLSGTKSLVVTNGVATFADLSINKAGAGFTLVAQSGSLTQDTSTGFTISPATATHMLFLTAPSNSVAGRAITPAVRVELLDALGNIVTSDNSTVVNLAIGTNPAAGTLSGGSSITVSGGIAVFNNLSIDKAGFGYTLTATAGSLPAINSGPFRIDADAVTHVRITQQPGNGIAGIALSPGLSVGLFDQFDNLATNDGTDTVQVALGANPGGGTLSGSTTLTVNGGQATFANLSVDKAGVGYTLVASSGALPTAASAGFTIVPAAPVLVSFGVQPTNAVAGAFLSPAVTVALLDAFGNLATNDSTDLVNMALGQNPGGSTLSGTTAVTVQAGVATFTNLALDKAGAGYTLRASSGTLPTATSTGFTISAGTADHLGFGVQPSNAVAGVFLNPAVTLRVFDRFNNPVTTDNSDMVTVAFGTNPGGGTLTGTLTQTVQAGVATFADLSVDKAAAGYTLTAGSGTLLGATSSSFTISAAAADHIGFGVQPSGVLAGVALSPVVTVVARDRFGNLAASDNSDVVFLSLSTNPGGATLTGTTQAVTRNGVAIFNPLTLDKTGTGYVLGASANGLGVAFSNAFTVSPGAADHLLFGVQPSNGTAGVALSPAVTVTLYDRLGNAVVNDNTTRVSVALGQNPGGGTLAGTTTVTVQGGVATFSNVSVNKAASGYTLAASSSPLSGATSAAFTIVAGVADHLLFSVQPANATAGVALSPVVTVRVLDRFGNLAVQDNSDAVTLGLAVNPTGATLNGNTTVTAQGGVAAFPGINLTTAGTGYALGASATGLTGATSNSFRISAAVADHLRVTAPPSAVAWTPSAVTVTALDPFNNTAPTYGGRVHITSTDGAATLPADFTFGVSDGGTHTFAAGATFVNAGTQTVTATDTANSAITGTSGAVAVTNPTPTLTSLSQTSVAEGSGVVTLTLTGDLFVPGSTVQVDGVTVATTFVGKTQLKATVPATTLAEEGTRAIAVTNPAPGGGTSASKTVTITDAPLTFTGGTFTNGQGVVVSNATVASFVDQGGAEAAGSYAATLNWGDGTAADTGNVVLTSGNNFAVLGSHTYAAAGKYTVQVTIRDEGGSQIAGPATAQIGSPNEQLVSALYQDLLDRAVDPDGLRFWAGLLDKGLTQAQFVQAITNSPEYHALRIQGVFQSLLRHPATPAQIASAAQLFNSSLLFVPGSKSPLDLLKIILISSDEYFQTHGGTNASFLQNAYLDLFGRGVDPAGASYYGGRLATGTARGTVARDLVSSLEAKQSLADSYYMELLGRHGDAGGLSFFGNYLEAGGKEDNIILALVSSAEFHAHL